MNLEFEAPDGVWYDSAAGWLFIGILGGCGCGTSDELGELALTILRYFALDWPDRQKSPVRPYDDDHPEYELLAHWLDSKELIEHGTSVGGSWLTDKGKEVLKYIDNHKRQQSS